MTIMAILTRPLHQWIFCVVALGVWLSQGWPLLMAIAESTQIRGSQVSTFWLIPFLLFGAAVLGAMALRPRPSVQWALIGVELAAVVAMAIIFPWAGMSAFLVIIAWQVALITSPIRALGWAAFQTLVIIGTLAVSTNPDLCWVITKSFALQLLLVLTGIALWREAETARELQSAQAIIANTARSMERLRISRELHDAWGHELTALGLQLEIASHVSDPVRANEHVVKAKGLARDLLSKVRDVVATLREADRCDLKDALEALAESVPSPAIHVDVAPELRIGPDQAHALVRCAQEAITNAVKHAEASNLWLRVTPDGEGVRLIARNDGRARRTTSSPGSGLLGMRERLEHLGGRLAVQKDVEVGFTIDAWLPAESPRSA